MLNIRELEVLLVEAFRPLRQYRQNKAELWPLQRAFFFFTEFNHASINLFVSVIFFFCSRRRHIHPSLACDSLDIYFSKNLKGFMFTFFIAVNVLFNIIHIQHNKEREKNNNIKGKPVPLNIYFFSRLSEVSYALFVQQQSSMRKIKID